MPGLRSSSFPQDHPLPPKHPNPTQSAHQFRFYNTPIIMAKGAPLSTYAVLYTAVENTSGLLF